MKTIYVVGSLNMDLVIHTDTVPRQGETCAGYGFMKNAGGKGANQAAAAAKLGGRVCMVGCVGKENGKDLLEALAQSGVDTRYVQVYDDVPSGTAVILVVGADNRIVLDSGANARVGISLIEEALLEAQAGDILVTQCEVSVAAVEYALRLAKKKGMTTIFNPAPAAELGTDVFSFCDYIVPNQTETEFYTGVLPEDEEGIRRSAGIFLRRGAKNVLITLGEEGAVCMGEAGYVRIPSCNAGKVLDTTAAGDTYIGALAVCLAEDMSLRNAMLYAGVAAGLTVTRQGAQQSMPLIDEVIKLFEDLT